MASKKKQPTDMIRKHVIVYDPIFNQQIHVFCNLEPDEYVKWQKKMNVTKPDTKINHNITAFATHISGENEPNTYIIWINEFKWTLFDQGTLIHEIVHIVIRIWGANNIKFNLDTQEFLAHSVGKLYEDIGAKLLRVSKK